MQGVSLCSKHSCLCCHQLTLILPQLSQAQTFQLPPNAIISTSQFSFGNRVHSPAKKSYYLLNKTPALLFFHDKFQFHYVLATLKQHYLWRMGNTFLKRWLCNYNLQQDFTWKNIYGKLQMNITGWCSSSFIWNPMKPETWLQVLTSLWDVMRLWIHPGSLHNPFVLLPGYMYKAEKYCF